MIDGKNVLEIINEIVVIPVSILTFLLLMYIVVYLWKKDPDVIRSRIFLKYREFKKAFFLLAVFALVLVLHVALIYFPHFFSIGYGNFVYNLQRIFGLVLILILITFVYFIYKSIRESPSL